VFVPVTSNIVADALSRLISSIAAAAAAPACLAITNRILFDLRDMVQALRSSTGLQIVTQRVGDLNLIGDAATGTF
jgi:hypothetical protein